MRPFLGLCAVLLLTEGATAGPPPERPALVLSTGAFDAAEGQRAAEVGLQVRWPTRIWRFEPVAGAMVTSATAANVYAGLSLDVPAGRRLVFRGTFAPGLYSRGGEGKDLGGVIQFRSGLGVGLRVLDDLRIGLEYYHLSNGGLGSINPGQESLVLTVSLPVGKRPAGSGSAP